MDSRQTIGQKLNCDSRWTFAGCFVHFLVHSLSYLIEKMSKTNMDRHFFV